MSADRNKPSEKTPHFLPEEFLLFIKRFNNLPYRNKAYIVEAVENMEPELMSNFLLDVERIIMRDVSFGQND